jgi:Zn-dependent protease/predicted transcriptional regulator
MMFGKRVTLFQFFGFKVRVDASWLIVAVLITWSLATGLFPHEYEGMSAADYWWMGIAGALGLFFSIVVHEFFHSVVARRLGLPMNGITLFIFGGVAEMNEEPESPRVEFLMAVAGPASSVALGFIFYAVYFAGSAAGWPPQISGILEYLASINWILAVFNLLPAFPLDGGRILRAALWKWKDNLRWATHRAARVGAGFGVFLIFVGVINLLFGNFIGGFWLFLIGMFLRGAAESSYQQLVIRKALEGTSVRSLMKQDPVTAPPSLSLDRLVEDYIYKFHFKMFPVVDGGRLDGCITTKQVKEVPRDQWGHKTVGDVVIQCSSRTAVPPDYDAMQALGLMSRTGNSRLLVVEDGKLLGVISSKDLMRHIAVKMDLEGGGEEKTQ